MPKDCISVSFAPMSALQYFEKFNEIIIYRAGDINTQTFLLKELMNYEGIYHEDLLKFLCWLISNNGNIYCFCNP